MNISIQREETLGGKGTSSWPCLEKIGRVAHDQEKTVAHEGGLHGGPVYVEMFDKSGGENCGSPSESRIGVRSARIPRQKSWGRNNLSQIRGSTKEPFCSPGPTKDWGRRGLGTIRRDRYAKEGCCFKLRVGKKAPEIRTHTRRGRNCHQIEWTGARSRSASGGT